jgi:hypothetical protein
VWCTQAITLEQFADALQRTLDAVHTGPRQVRFRRDRFCPTGELKYRGARRVRIQTLLIDFIESQTQVALEFKFR